MKLKRNVLIGAALVTALAALGVAQRALETAVDAQAAGAVMAPRFEVDPMWPKPMPNHWLFGNTIGVGVDKAGQRLHHPSRCGLTRSQGSLRHDEPAGL